MYYLGRLGLGESRGRGLTSWAATSGCKSSPESSGWDSERCYYSWGVRLTAHSGSQAGPRCDTISGVYRRHDSLRASESGCSVPDGLGEEKGELQSESTHFAY
jgi:hypothetical protein